MITEKAILDLYLKASTVLPPDVRRRMELCMKSEKGNAKSALDKMLENARIAGETSRPMCQDTGTPIFYVRHGKSQTEKDIAHVIKKATVKANVAIPLRPNAIDALTGKVYGNSPVIHFEESEKGKTGIALLMKGGGSENVSCVYSLPDAKLNADRDIDGFRKCVLDAVFRAQGKACPPYVLGVAVGGTIEEVAHLSKKQLLRELDDTNDDKELGKLEKRLLAGINKLGIGPSGLGGKTTALAVKIAKTQRHPASCFVGVAFSCWALRRAKYGN